MTWYNVPHAWGSHCSWLTCAYLQFIYSWYTLAIGVQEELREIATLKISFCFSPNIIPLLKSINSCLQPMAATATQLLYLLCHNYIIQWFHFYEGGGQKPSSLQLPLIFATSIKFVIKLCSLENVIIWMLFSLDRIESLWKII